MKILLPFVVLMVAVALSASVTGDVGAEGATDSTMVERAKTHLRAWGQARTAEDAASVRDALLAIADTLEASGELTLAAQCLERAGISWYRLRDVPAAQEVWARGLDVAKRSGDKSRIAALLNANAVGVSASGDDERAIELFTELIDVRRDLDDARGEAIAWHNLAYSLMARFRNPAAMDALAHANRLHRLAGNQYGRAASMQSLAGLLFKYGQLDDAIAMIDAAFAIADSIGDPALVGTVANNRGHFLHYAGRVDEAIVSIEHAVAVQDSGGVVLGAAIARVNLADAFITAGRPADAVAMLDRARESIEASGDPSHAIAATTLRGAAQLAMNDTRGAIATLEASIARFDTVRASLDDDVARAELRKHEGESFGLLSMAHARESRPREAWWHTERSLAAVLSEQLGGSIGDGDTLLGGLQDRLRDINAIALEYSTPATGMGIVFVITPDDVIARELDLPLSIHRDISNAMRLMAAGADDAQCAPPLSRISAALLDPVRGSLSGDHERIVLIPGGFAGLAFEALPAGGEALGLSYPVTYAPSASVFNSLGNRAPAGGAFVAFADPSSDAPSDGHPVVAMRSGSATDIPLPETRDEVNAIAPPGATILIGDDATRQAFDNTAPSASVLHLATHAVADGNHPAGSALVLAGRDGRLHPADIRAVPLRADLVTLSACGTAGGYAVIGEGVFGLTRAFLLAGARSVVSSWWDVEDEAARRFMELFYAGLREGTPRDVAVMRARQTMAAEGYPHRDRSAFILTGATAEPVVLATTGGRAQPRYMLIVLGIIAGIAVVLFLRVRRRARP